MIKEPFDSQPFITNEVFTPKTGLCRRRVTPQLDRAAQGELVRLVGDDKGCTAHGWGRLFPTVTELVVLQIKLGCDALVAGCVLATKNKVVISGRYRLVYF